MKKSIKQALSLLLVAAMLVACIPSVLAAEDQTSGTVPVAITASTPTFSVTVPTTLPIHMDAYGDITCGDITITNNSAGPVQVEDTQLTALNGWTLVDYDTTTFLDTDKGQHRVALQLDRDNGVTAAGTDTGEDFIPAGGGQQTVSVAVKLPYQGVEMTDATVAQVVFVLGWYKYTVPLTGLTITGSDTVTVGETIQLTAAKLPPDTTSEDTIQWSSSNASIATVNSDGLVTGVGAGTASITASCGGKMVSKTVQVTNPQAPATIDGVRLTVGSSLWSDLSWPAKTATRTGSPYKDAYSYSVTFTNSLSSDAMDQQCSVTIPLVDGWEIVNPQMKVVTNGGTTNNNTVYLNGNNGDYFYYCYWPNFSGPSLWAGDYTFTITYVLAKSDDVYLRGLTITGDDTVDVGSTIQLTATKTPANTTDTGVITWSSSNTSVATVSSTGVVTGKSVGTAQITASRNGVTATASIRVNTPPPAVQSNGVTYKTTLQPNGVYSVTFTTECIVDTYRTSYVVVTPASNMTGMAWRITAEANGVTRVFSGHGSWINETSTSGYFDITYYYGGPATVTFEAMPLSLNGPDTLEWKSTGNKLTLTGVPDGYESQVTWTSSEGSIVSVDSNGNLSVGDIGRVTISASYNGLVVTKEITATWTPQDSYSFMLLLDGPTEANCTGGRYASCSGETYITGTFGGFNGASGTHSIALPFDAPKSAVDYLSVGNTYFSWLSGNTWVYEGYLPGGNNIAIMIHLVR